MYQLPQGQTNEAERAILRRLRVWIAALGLACLVVGVGVGAMLAGRPAVAQNDSQRAAANARAPEALSASFAEIAQRVEPAVVNIDTVSATPQVTEHGAGNSPGTGSGNSNSDSDDDSDDKDGGGDNPLMEMFRRQLPQRPSRGVGSGFIVDPKGYILTNQHVVEGATRITVRLQSGELMRGRVVGEDDETDIAVVKVEPLRDLPTVKLGNSDEAQVGDWVLAVGSPFGLDQTVTAGIISTRERTTPVSSSFQRFLQTDAAINRGNSGGPLVNMRGEVIGINSQIATSTGDYNGIGFALPSNEASFVYRQLVAGGRVKRGYLGVLLDSVKAEFARVYNLKDAKGAIITDVREGPARTAGIQVNDIIVEFNAKPISNSQDLINKVASTPVGETVQLTFLRDVNGQLERRTVGVSVGERPPRGAGEATPTLNATTPSLPKLNSDKPSSDRPTLGLTLSELTPQLANERNLKGVRGLLVRDVDQSGLAYEAQIGENMVIQRVNRIPVNTLAEFERVINNLKVGDAVVMNVTYLDRRNLITQTIIQFTYQ
ncbi:MAG: serine protease Do [Pyrinomonadaceae bacterium]|nr:serine protease Do [Pyrinomonadaceae bacterium]MDX6272108.1 serine protease Do [Acidobacteriota bacterium]